MIFELSTPGERGIRVPLPEQNVRNLVGEGVDSLPEGLRRTQLPSLPEMGQMRVLRHFLRLSQETLGADLNIDIGQGTCTMKYSPKVNERILQDSGLRDLHPLVRSESAQGVLEIFWRLGQFIAEISGLDVVTLQPAAGSAAIWTNVAIIRAYHRERGEGDSRDEVITTSFSHPSNAACAKTAGYRVLTLPPDREGYPDMELLRAAVSHRTAGLLITNPEDTGIFNPRIAEVVDIIHGVGGLAAYDQANANGILGITRAREAGFDLCHFNLHKTFSTPHASGGPAAGACAAKAELSPFLPIPVVSHDGQKPVLDYDRPYSIGKVSPFYGVVPNVVRAYAWIRSLGAEGLRLVAETAVLNNNYLMDRILDIEGASAPYATGRRRLEQTRYSWKDLTEETAVTSSEIGVRASDFAVHYWTSHHPHVVPEPFTLEPTESYSMAELDEYADILAAVAHEARSNPKMVRNAPYQQSIHRIDPGDLDDPERWVTSWRAYNRKYPNRPTGHSR